MGVLSQTGWGLRGNSSLTSETWTKMERWTRMKSGIGSCHRTMTTPRPRPGIWCTSPTRTGYAALDTVISVHMNHKDSSCLFCLIRIRNWPNRRFLKTGTCLSEVRPPTMVRTSPGTMMSFDISMEWASHTCLSNRHFRFHIRWTEDGPAKVSWTFSLLF